MKARFSFIAVMAISVLAVCAQTQRIVVIEDRSAAQAPISNNGYVEWTNVGWSQEEAKLSDALAIRARELEAASGIKFDAGWKPKADLEFYLGDDPRRKVDGEYQPETKLISFVISLTYRINVAHTNTIRLMDPNVIAHDETFSGLAWHELGHALVDQVSRRNGLGTFPDPLAFGALSRAEQMGVNIISEGIAMHFERLGTDGAYGSSLSFPADYDQAAHYRFDIIANDGGYWIVHDAISRYGERAIVWFLKHPLVATDTSMRSDAILYREKAMRELGGH